MRRYALVVLTGVLLVVGLLQKDEIVAATKKTWKLPDGRTISYADHVPPYESRWYRIYLSTPCSLGMDKEELVFTYLPARKLAGKLAEYYANPRPLRKLATARLDDGDEAYLYGDRIYIGRRCSSGHLHNRTQTYDCKDGATANLILNVLAVP